MRVAECIGEVLEKHVKAVFRRSVGHLATCWEESHSVRRAGALGVWVIHCVVAVVVECRANVEGVSAMVCPGASLIGAVMDNDSASSRRKWGTVEVKVSVDLSVC